MTESIRVLVVEDDPITAEAHAAYVSRVEGYVAAGIAHTGHEAFRMLRHAREGRIAPIDLILLDVNLPDTTGIELCRSLRASGIEIDVIAVTAVRDAAVVRSAVSLGIVQYLIKPFGFAAFAEKLHAYRDYHARVGSAGVTDQQEVDASFAALRTSSGADLPKGLTRETLDRVRAAVRDAPRRNVGRRTRRHARPLARHSAPLPRAPRRHGRGPTRRSLRHAGSPRGRVPAALTITDVAAPQGCGHASSRRRARPEHSSRPRATT